MKTKPHESAFNKMEYFGTVDDLKPKNLGLTKREWFAGMAMVGVEASNRFEANGAKEMATDEVAMRARLIADALIEELNK